MPVKQTTCWIPECDECKNTHENGDGITLHYDSREEALGEAEGYDWVELTDGRLVCDDCVAKLLAAGVIVENEDASKNDDPPYLLAPKEN